MMNVNLDELQEERERNLKKTITIENTWVEPKETKKCRECIDKKLAICLCCLNYRICDREKGNRQLCWIGDKCCDCEENRNG